MIAAGDLVPRVARRVAFAVLAIVTAILVGMAVGAAVGRWRVAAIERVGKGAHVGSSDAVFVVPVPAVALSSGDVIVAELPKGEHPWLLRVSSIVDPNQQRIAVRDRQGLQRELYLPHTVWRVQKHLPALGVIMRVVVSRWLGLLLGVFGCLLILYGEWLRHARTLLQPRIAPIEHV
jgi:hypothetical protein